MCNHFLLIFAKSGTTIVCFTTRGRLFSLPLVI